MSKHFPLIIVTGLSGSGKSTALNVFEDMGYFTVDGLPITLASQLIQLFSGASLANYKGLVLGMDLRHIEFVQNFSSILDEISATGIEPQIIFFEAKMPALMQRYATTRRPHPLEKEGLGLEKAIENETLRLKPLREKAQLVIDSSTFSIHDLRRVLQEKWQSLQKNNHALRVHLITFGFKYGTPAEADMVFDLRFLPNPYFNEKLRPLSGKDEAIVEFVLSKEPGKTFFTKWSEFIVYMLEQNEAEGRFRLTIAIGCTGGRHRSVAAAESLYSLLLSANYSCSLEHRHLELG